MGQIASKSPKKYSYQKPKIQRFSSISNEVINEIDSLRSHRFNKKINTNSQRYTDGRIMVC